MRVLTYECSSDKEAALLEALVVRRFDDNPERVPSDKQLDARELRCNIIYVIGCYPEGEGEEVFEQFRR